MNNPKTIAFATSAGAIDLLSIYLHRLEKISLGKIIQHQWFKKLNLEQKIEPLYERKIGIDFPNKKEIYDLMCKIEEKRNILAYSNSTKKDVENILISFWKLKKLIEKLIGEKYE